MTFRSAACAFCRFRFNGTRQSAARLRTKQDTRWQSTIRYYPSDGAGRDSQRHQLERLRQTSGPDLIRWALLPPSRPRHQDKVANRILLQALEHLEDASTTASMGTHPEATSQEKDGRGPAEFSSVGTDLADALDHASDPVDIATAVRSAVRKGLALVDMERIDQHMDGALRRLPIRTRQSWYYADAVHSITFFLRHNQLPVGRCLCVTGLHVGIRWLAEPLIKSYLEDLVQNDYRLPPTTWETLLSRLCMSARFGPDDRRRIGAWKKKDALQILTGWPVSGVGSPGDQRDMCLASSMPMHEPEVFLHYVEALGKLGASDALWALWKSHAGSRTGEDAYPSAPAKPNTLTVNVFAKAFLAANDLSRAIHVVDPLVWGACHRPSNLEVSRWFQSRPKNTSIEDHLSNMKSALDDFVKSSRGVYMQSLDSVVDRLEDTLARDRRPV